MADLIKPGGSGLVGLLHRKGEKGLTLPIKLDEHLFALISLTLLLYSTRPAG